jgi:hypothetical protein
MTYAYAKLSHCTPGKNILFVNDLWSALLFLSMGGHSVCHDAGWALLVVTWDDLCNWSWRGTHMVTHPFMCSHLPTSLVLTFMLLQLLNKTLGFWCGLNFKMSSKGSLFKNLGCQLMGFPSFQVLPHHWELKWKPHACRWALYYLNHGPTPTGL